jgi:hypothetical protein
LAVNFFEIISSFQNAQDDSKLLVGVIAIILFNVIFLPGAALLGGGFVGGMIGLFKGYLEDLIDSFRNYKTRNAALDWLRNPRADLQSSSLVYTRLLENKGEENTVAQVAEHVVELAELPDEKEEKEQALIVNTALADANDEIGRAFHYTSRV